MARPPLTRCAWVPLDDPQYVRYHDEEWGVPVHDDATLFEFLTLEGAQAGLSWATILRKRANYRLACDGFDAVRIAQYDQADVERLMRDDGIVRNRRKIEAMIGNARAWLEPQAEFGTASAALWSIVGEVPLRNAWRRIEEIPTQTPQSVAMSRLLTSRGFRFVGPTICYAFMQAVGMVNDHTVDCFRHREV